MQVGEDSWPPERAAPGGCWVLGAAARSRPWAPSASPGAQEKRGTKRPRGRSGQQHLLQCLHLKPTSGFSRRHYRDRECVSREGCHRGSKNAHLVTSSPRCRPRPPNWGNKCHSFKLQFLSVRLANQPPTLSPWSSSRGISASVPPRSQRLAVTLDLHHSPVFISYLPLLAPSPWSPARRPPRLEPILACCLAWVLIAFCFDPSSSPCYSLPPCRAISPASVGAPSGPASLLSRCRKYLLFSWSLPYPGKSFKATLPAGRAPWSKAAWTRPAVM